MSAGARPASGRPQVQLVGKFGLEEVARPTFRHEHFYRALEPSSGVPAAATAVAILKGVLHGLDMKRLANGSTGSRRTWCMSNGCRCRWSIGLPVQTAAARSPGRDRARQQSLQRRRRCHDALGYMALARTADAVIVHTGQAEARLAEAGVARNRVHRLPHGLLHAAGPASSDGAAAVVTGNCACCSSGKSGPTRAWTCCSRRLPGFGLSIAQGWRSRSSASLTSTRVLIGRSCVSTGSKGR